MEIDIKIPTTADLTKDLNNAMADHSPIVLIASGSRYTLKIDKKHGGIYYCTVIYNDKDNS